VSKIMDDVQYRAGTIGRRGTDMPAEAAAAEYGTERRTSLGHASEKFAYSCIPDQNAFHIAGNLMAGLAAAVYHLGWMVIHWLKDLLCLGAVHTDNNPHCICSGEGD
jgi:hypothetical protein